MKALTKSLTIALFAAATLPLLADEPQKTTTATTPATTTAAPPPPAAKTTPDSPLVAASKLHGKKKGTIVITNDNLKKEGGHFTTTNSTLELPKPVKTEIVTEMDPVTKKRAEEYEKQQAERAAKEKAKHDRRMAAANREIEGDTPESLYDDPAEVEHRAETMTQQTTTQKPPL